MNALAQEGHTMSMAGVTEGKPILNVGSLTWLEPVNSR
jgi:hypothetical protein